MMQTICICVCLSTVMRIRTQYCIFPGGYFSAQSRTLLLALWHIIPVTRTENNRIAIWRAPGLLGNALGTQKIL
jgi:hypothetical protein